MASTSGVIIGVIDALCPGCNNVKRLEACFHCMQPLCSECISNHVEIWKQASIKYCELTNQKIDKYSSKLSSLNPLVIQNQTNITKVKSQIEENFQEFITKLTQQKDDLFKRLDLIDSENQEFIKFESNLLKLKQNLSKFQQDINKNDFSSILDEFNTFQSYKEDFNSIGTSYSILKNKPFKIIGEYEQPRVNGLENFFGNLIINESELLKSSNDQSKKEKSQLVKSAAEVNKDNDKIHMFGTLRVKLRRLAEQMNELQPKVKSPVLEFDLNITPKFIANNSKLIFISDESGNLLITELNKTLVIKASLKLYIMNIRGISANKHYLAVSFSDLSQEQIQSVSKSIKNFNLKSGVLLFKLSESNTNLTLEKTFSTGKNYNLLSPVGVGLTDSYLFVCDRELHAFFKIELKTGNLNQRFITTDEEPTSISVGEKYFVYTDALKLELNLVDMDKFTISKTVKFSEDLFNEPFDLVYKEKSYIFVKNRADTRCILYDSKLNIKYSFEYENSNSQGISFIILNGKEYLILGNCKLESKKFKIGLFSDF